MKQKLSTLEESIQVIKSGTKIAIGGNALHRVPMAFVREILKSDVKELHLINTAGAHEIDVLCANQQVCEVSAGFVSYESGFGLANHYRKAVQEGQIKANEHACYTIISALRAASVNAPFMPVRGLENGDLLVENNYFIRVVDPFTGTPITLVQALVPDVAVIHAQEVDEFGNTWIEGPVFDDVLLSKAAKHVIITAEKIVRSERMRLKANTVTIPGFLVDQVVLARKGADPCSVYGQYEINQLVLEKYCIENQSIQDYLTSYEKMTGRRGNYG